MALLAGLAANLLIPISYILGVSLVMDAWHNPDEVQNILVGLALVASMPVAGSSTAWSQNANGDLALSLGLVLGSTLLSPLTTPAALHAVGFLTTGDYSEDLHELASLSSSVNVITHVTLTGHADAVGTGTFNLSLSLARAEAVRALLKKRGVDPDMLTVRGAGQLEPLEEASSEAARAANRRVTFKVGIEEQ